MSTEIETRDEISGDPVPGCNFGVGASVRALGPDSQGRVNAA